MGFTKSEVYKHCVLQICLFTIEKNCFLCSVQLLLGTAESAGNYSEDVLKGALAGVVGLYALNIFKIIVGVIGLVLSNKKSALTVALGFLLFIAQLAAFFQSGNGISEIVVNIILLAIPYYYLHNAYKNYKD